MIRSSGHVTFCDDVREEVRGKVTLVGCYGPDMNFEGSFPAMLPKLGMAIRLYTFKRTEPFRLGLKVTVPGQAEPAIEVDQVVPPPPVDPKLKELEPDPNKSILIATNILLGPTNITERGAIRVFATVGDDEFQVGAIMISASPPVSAQDASPFANFAPQ